jgi:hypothetical protein
MAQLTTKRSWRSSLRIGTADLPVTIEIANGEYLATQRKFGVWGAGATEAAALEDLSASFKEYHEDLPEYEGRLSPRLSRHLAELRALTNLDGSL